MVYPGAMHTRFEHSLGVMHLATKMYEKIVEKKRGYLVNKLGFNDSGFDSKLGGERPSPSLRCLAPPDFCRKRANTTTSRF